MVPKFFRHKGKVRVASLVGGAMVLALIVLSIGPLATGGQAAAVTRTYYIAADEVDWDYAPTGINQVTGEPFGEVENTYLENGKDRIGRVNIKALYREYTDATFTKLKPRDAKWQHLGLLGPVLRGAVGDTIKIVFKNNTRFPTSMHPHGVFYQKDSEGFDYNDGSGASTRGDGAVPTGGNWTYNWSIPDRAGPGPMDPSSIVWAYHSHTDETGDTNAGLIGAIVVTKAGMAKADGSPTDVDRELVTMYTVFDENSSPYLDANVEKFAKSPSTINRNDSDFEESNLKHSINGLMFGNLQDLTMNQGERVRWYVIGIGTEVDLHTPHWHANTLLWMGSRTDMVELLPMSMKTLDMKPDAAGTWVLHCHVNDHIDAGMITKYVVNSARESRR